MTNGRYRGPIGEHLGHGRMRNGALQPRCRKEFATYYDTSHEDSAKQSQNISNISNAF
jgi:hypothetical protein